MEHIPAVKQRPLADRQAKAREAAAHGQYLVCVTVRPDDRAAALEDVVVRVDGHATVLSLKQHLMRRCGIDRHQQLFMWHRSEEGEETQVGLRESFASLYTMLKAQDGYVYLLCMCMEAKG